MTFLHVSYLIHDYRGFSEGCRKAVLQDRNDVVDAVDDGSDNEDGDGEEGKVRESRW